MGWKNERRSALLLFPELSGPQRGGLPTVPVPMPARTAPGLRPSPPPRAGGGGREAGWLTCRCSVLAAGHANGRGAETECAGASQVQRPGKAKWAAGRVLLEAPPRPARDFKSSPSRIFTETHSPSCSGRGGKELSLREAETLTQGRSWERWGPDLPIS